jgi:hypothetical protein
MDPNYRASEDHWRLIENWPGLGEYPSFCCILELRARIEALEAAQQPADHIPDARKMVAPPAPAGGLVKRLSHLLAKRFSESQAGTDCTPFACDVLREVAAWLRSDGPDWPSVASLLEQEASQ